MSRRRSTMSDPGPSLEGGLNSRGHLRVQSLQLALPGARVHSHRALQACGAKIWRSVLPSNRPATPLFSPACWEPGFQAWA